jgi:hypothetical protein
MEILSQAAEGMQGVLTKTADMIGRVLSIVYSCFHESKKLSVLIIWIGRFRNNMEAQKCSLNQKTIANLIWRINHEYEMAVIHIYCNA